MPLLIPSIAVAAGGVAALAARSWYETNRFRAERVSVGDPAKGSPLRIAWLSDFHFRPRGDALRRLVHRAIEASLEFEPDLIALGGDYVVDWDESSCGLVEAGLEPLREVSIPKIAVLGNHDYYEGDPQQLCPLFEKLEIQLLRNDHMVLQDRAAIIGLDSSHQEEDESERVLSETPEGMPRVIFWHEPDAVERLPKKAANLMIAGHTHGGQFLSPWGWGEFASKNAKKYVRGYFDSDPPIPLYVSRGIGTIGLHARLFAPAELSLITLYC